MTGFRIKRCAHLQRRGVSGGEDEIRGSHLDWRLEIVEGQHGLWSVTQATAVAKKNPDQGVRLCCLVHSVTVWLYFFSMSSWDLTNGSSNIWHWMIVDTFWWGQYNGMFFTCRIIRMAAAPYQFVRERLEQWVKDVDAKKMVICLFWH